MHIQMYVCMYICTYIHASCVCDVGRAHYQRFVIAWILTRALNCLTRTDTCFYNRVCAGGHEVHAVPGFRRKISCSHTHTHTHTHAHTYAQTHILKTQAHTHARTGTHTHIHTHRHACTGAHAHAQTHKFTDTCKHARALTNHTCAHASVYLVCN